jgi:lipopolysaccharide export system permease protein
MIFQRSLQRELKSTAGAVFTTLFTITVTVMLIKILGQAAGGRVSSQDVMALITFQSLNYLPVILILTGFISVLLVVTRSYQDSEMVVWFASGLSLTRWIRPVFNFGWPLILIVAILSFVATPWANLKSGEYQERFEKREDIARVSPGKFQESASANRIFFVEGFSNDATKVRNVFVNTVKDGVDSLVVAKTGEMVTDADGEKFVVMEKGRRYDGVPGQLNLEIIEFERYGVSVETQSRAEAASRATRALSTPELIRNPDRFNYAELLWRIALPLMASTLMLLAIPLAFVNPRAGRSIGLLIALLLFFIYSNVVSVFQAAVAQDRMDFLMAWWPIHLGVLAFAVFMFSWRLKVNSKYHPLVLWLHLRRLFILKRHS